MRRLVPAVLAAAVVLTGCGGATPDGSADPSATPAAPSTGSLDAPAPLPAQAALPDATGGRGLSSAELADALLPVTALPAGFSQDPDAPAAGAEAGSGADAASQVGTATPAVCGQLLAPLAGVTSGASGDAARSFTGADAFTTVTQDAASYPGAGALAALAAVRSAAAQCTTFTSTDVDGVAGSYAVGAAEGVVGAGDASTVLRVVGSSEGVQVVFDVAVAVVGSVAVQVVAAGLAPVDPAALSAAVATAADRLRTAQA